MLMIEPERIVYALEGVWPINPDVPLSSTSSGPQSALVAQTTPQPMSAGAEYFRGLRDGVNYIVDQVLEAIPFK